MHNYIDFIIESHYISNDLIWESRQASIPDWIQFEFSRLGPFDVDIHVLIEIKFIQEIMDWFWTWRIYVLLGIMKFELFVCVSVGLGGGEGGYI